MKTVKWIIENMEEIIASILFSLVITLLFIQVIARYVFGQGIAWSEELLRFSFLVMVYFAAALGAKRGSHFRVTLITNYLPEKLKLYFEFIPNLIFLAFNCFVIYLGTNLIIGMKGTIQTSPVLGLNLRYIYATIPVSFLFITIRLIIKMVNDYKLLKGNTTT